MNKLTHLIENNKNIFKTTLLKKGAINGLTAFLVSYVIVIVISIGVNLTVISHLSEIIQGSIGNDLNFSVANIVKVNNIILNFSVFNSIGEIKLGLLVMAIIPIVAFYAADRTDNIDKGLTVENTLKMLVASVVYSLILIILSLITRGEFVGVSVDFTNFRNFLNTIMITLLIQLVIASSYHKDAHQVIIASRMTIRGVTLISLVLSVFYLVGILKNVGMNMLLKIGASMAIIFNVIAYEIFKCLGVKIGVSDDLSKVLETVNFDINYSPIWIKFSFIGAFIVLIGFSIYRFADDYFIRFTLSYALLISGFLSGLAYYTTVNFGVVSFVGDVRFGVNVLNTFSVSFFYIIVVGILVFLMKRVIKISKG